MRSCVWQSLRRRIGNDNNWAKGSVHIQLYNNVLGMGVNGAKDAKFRWRAQQNVWYFISMTYVATRSVAEGGGNCMYRNTRTHAHTHCRKLKLPANNPSLPPAPAATSSCMSTAS